MHTHTHPHIHILKRTCKFKFNTAYIQTSRVLIKPFQCVFVNLYMCFCFVFYESSHNKLYAFDSRIFWYIKRVNWHIISIANNEPPSLPEEGWAANGFILPPSSFTVSCTAHKLLGNLLQSTHLLGCLLVSSLLYAYGNFYLVANFANILASKCWKIGEFAFKVWKILLNFRV